MKNIVNFCDFFVICSGNNARQVNAISFAVEEGLAELGFHVKPRRGTKDSLWIVFDTGDIVVHIFEKKAREFYNLEHLWQEAKEVKLPDFEQPAK